MANLHIRNIPEDICSLIQIQAKEKNMTQNEYLLLLLSHSALVGIPDLARLLPETIQYTIRSILLSEASRTRAYTEAQLSLIRDNMVALDRCTSLLSKAEEEQKR